MSYSKFISTVKNNNQTLLFFTVLLNIIYILLKDTIAFHKMTLPSTEAWIIILSIFIVLITGATLRSEEKNEYLLLNIAVILSIVAGIMVVLKVGYPSDIFEYILLTISVSTVIAIIISKNNKLRYYAITLGIFTLNEFFSIIEFNSVITILGVIFEMVLLFSIIIFIYRAKPDKLEISIMLISALIGFSAAMIITGIDVVPLILRTIIEQMLGVFQYAIFSGSGTYFFALHFAEIFTIFTFIYLKRKSKLVFSIIALGFDFSFPPITAIRTLAILMYLKLSEDNTNVN